MASLAGFLDEYALVVLGFDPDADEFVIDIAEVGLINGNGDAPPGFGDDINVEDGCCRTAKTKVLLRAIL